MRYEVLDDEEFTKEYHKAFVKQKLANEAAKEKFRDAVFTVQLAIEKALESKWKKIDDFEVGANFDYCHQTGGGIYSDTIFCKSYVETICKALQSVDPGGIWTYHTVCEIIVNPEGKTSAESTEERGDFFVRGGTCYLNRSTMIKDWRARLRCPN